MKTNAPPPAQAETRPVGSVCPGNLIATASLKVNLVDQGPLEPVEDPPSRLAGNNQVPDFGEDVAGTLHDPSNEG